MPLIIIGSILSLAMGIILGLIGGGGSILTLPILVYFFGFSVSIATAYSLFVVGLTSAVGIVIVARKKMIDIRAAAIFAPISAATVFSVRRFLLPALPEAFELKAWHVSLDTILLLVFALVMLASSISMIWYNRSEKSQNQQDARSPVRMGIIAMFVGLLTGIVGAGGGFLFVPSLILFASLPVKKAIGTSLAIIAVNSLIGFSGDMLGGLIVDWRFLLSFSIMPVIGIFAGNALLAHLSGPHLKKIFGWFVLITGLSIIVSNIWTLGAH